MKQVNLIKLLISVLFCSWTLTSCSHKDTLTSDEPPIADDSRTVIVYMVATNSLNGADSDDLNQMRIGVKGGALGEHGRLLVYQTTYNTAPRLFSLNADGTTTIIKTYDTTVNSLDPTFMAGVINEAMAVAPANDYGLILWSHSTGWRGVDTQSVATAPTSDDTDDGPQLMFGDDNGTMMSIPELAQALDNVPHLAFIYFDSCFMGNVEVAYELRNAADWLLASPAETPYDGSYYSESLAPLYGELPSGLSDCARTTYDYYAGQTTASKRSLTLSVYRMSAIEPLADAVADIYAASAPLSSVNGLQQYGFAARWAYFPNNFFDIDNYLTARTSSTALTSQLSDALNDFVYAHYATPMMWNQYPLTHVSGLSVFPYDELSSTGDRYSYTELAWYKRVYR